MRRHVGDVEANSHARRYGVERFLERGLSDKQAEDSLDNMPCVLFENRVGHLSPSHGPVLHRFLMYRSSEVRDRISHLASPLERTKVALIEPPQSY